MITNVKFTMTVDSGNAALVDNLRDELGRMLSRVHRDIDRDVDGGKLRDTNGNTVGEWSIELEEDETESTYRVVRYYQDRDTDSEIVETGLTLAEAKDACQDPETSSRTASTPEGLARTREHGAWFHGFEEE